MPYVDLHIHSYYSDGTMSPKEIIKAAKEKNVAVISITDHDILEGSKEAVLQAESADITCISGVELDTIYRDTNFHILGYDIDLEDEEFRKRVSGNRKLLEEVNIKLIKKMEEDYTDVTLADYEEFTYQCHLGGWKTLHYFIYKGITANLIEGLEVYRKYNHQNTCVSFPTIKEITGWIHDAGGKSILAHPGKVICTKDIQKFKDILLEIVEMGIDGIECYYPSHTKEVTGVCLQVCKENNLLITSGADCHGDFGNADIGELCVEMDKLRL